MNVNKQKNHTVQQYCTVIHYNSSVQQGCPWVVGLVHKEINQSPPSGIIHGHLKVLVRHKQAQMCLQSNPKHYELISTFKIFYSLQIFYCLTHHSFTDAFSQVQWKIGYSYTALLLWQRCSKFRSKKAFHNIKCLHVYALFSYS